MHRHLETTRQAALGHDFDNSMSFRLAATIVKSGKPIATGFNSFQSNGFVDYYTAKMKSVRNSHTTHAEMDAVLRARNVTDLAGTKIYVVRIMADGTYGMARPCEICETILFRYGIKRAIYSISDHEYGVMKTRDLLLKQLNKEVSSPCDVFVRR